ncbi:hypothetical protein LVY72_15810 [Arthrobacter sp. I2-34]|uniref:MBG domain-containing protein n=1 Tax=Arthrobacter hankyongi TaxID=2904801 RepID=A0ABS9LA62_9MICC|nr:hypothetical protein [Arthrobacter hankyongi]MCG2623362.1 hypothetical protein [Arthrobacter hankyongi]
MPGMVEYFVNGSARASGTYSANGQKINIVAKSLPGFVLSKAATWSFDFSPAITMVTAAAPSFNKSSGTVTVPEVPGVRYSVNGLDKATGSYGGYQANVTVTATALAGYALSGPTTWVFDFTPAIAMVTAAAPGFNKSAGTVTVPDVPGVRYSVNGVDKGAGSHSGHRTKVTVTATAHAGYALSGPASWTFDFTPAAVKTTPAAPSFSRSADRYTIPAKAGVQYYANGKPVKAGSYSGNRAKVTVTAKAAAGYVLSGTTAWSFDFAPVRVVPAAVTFGKKSGTYTIPGTAGVRYYVGGKQAKAGTYPANRRLVTVSAKALAGYRLSGTAAWKYDFRTKTTAAKPSFNGTKNSYTIPRKSGVKYYVNGRYKPAGTYQAGNGRKLTFTAKASSPSHRLSGTSAWTYRF